MAIDTPDFLQLAQLASPGLLGPVLAAAGASVGIADFTLSPFATGIIVIPIGGTDPLDCYIHGAVSSNEYASVVFPAAAFPPVSAVIPGATDNPVSVTIDLQSVWPGPGSETIAWVYQLFGTGIQFIQNTPQQPVFVQQSLAKSGTSSNAQLKSAQVGATLAASSSATLLAAVAGKTVTVYGYDLSINPHGAGVVGLYQATFEDTTAAVVLAAFTLQVMTLVGQVGLQKDLAIAPGLALPVGAGIKVVTTANVASLDIGGTILYTQQ